MIKFIYLFRKWRYKILNYDYYVENILMIEKKLIFFMNEIKKDYNFYFL